MSAFFFLILVTIDLNQFGSTLSCLAWFFPVSVILGEYFRKREECAVREKTILGADIGGNLEDTNRVE